MKLLAAVQTDQIKRTLSDLVSDEPDLSVSILEGSLADPDGLKIKPKKGEVLLLEVKLSDSRSLSALEKLRQSLDVPILVTSDDAKIDDVRWLMRIGVDDFLPQPLSGPDVLSSMIRAVQSKTPQPTDAAPDAFVVAVTAPGKGHGVSTVATQLALSLHRQFKKERSILLVDFDFQYGKIANHLDLAGRLNINEINRAPARLDSALLGSYVVEHETGIDVAGPAESDSALFEDIGTDGICRFLEVAARTYDCVVIAMPPIWARWCKDICKAVDAVVLVMESAVDSIRHSRGLLARISHSRAGAEGIYVALNKFKKNFLWSTISVPDVEKAIGHGVDFRIPENVEVVEDASNRGVPLRKVKAGNNVEKAIDAMAQQLLRELNDEREAAE